MHLISNAARIAYCGGICTAASPARGFSATDGVKGKLTLPPRQPAPRHRPAAAMPIAKPAPQSYISGIRDLA
jgi:hypothetical protein